MAVRLFLARAAVAASAFLLCCPRARALEPTSDANSFVHTAWTAREGLRDSVRSIAQTSDGYIWLGTDSGLLRFDGVRFVPWTAPGGQHLLSPRILALLGARDGTLWIGMIGGLASWKDSQLTQYPEAAGPAVLSLLEDHQGTIWVGGIGKVCSIQGGKVECRDLGRSEPSVYGNPATSVFSLHEDNEHRLWVGAESGLWQWKPALPQPVVPQPILQFQAVAQGDRATGLTLITGDPPGHVLRQITSNRIEPYALPGVEGRAMTPNRLLRDSHGALWVGTLDQGLFRVYNGTTTRFAQGDGLSSDFVLSLFEDREGNVWSGTANGLDRFRETGVSTISGSHGLSRPAWSVLSARDGSVWIGTQDGLNRWHQGQITIYRSTPPPTARVRRDENASVREVTDPGLPDNQIGTLFEDLRGRIWVTSRNGVAWFENGRFARVPGVAVGSGTMIAADGREGVWINHPDRGLVHVIEGRIVESAPWPWPGSHISVLIADPVKGGLWVGQRRGGVASFNDGHFGALLSNKDGVGADLAGLNIDHEGTLWAATERGLHRIKNGRVATLTTQNGLPCDAVRSAVEDAAFSLWLYTGCGLVRVTRTDVEAWAADSTRTIHATVLDAVDGVDIRSLLTTYAPVMSKSPDGKLWFAHGDGVSAIDPRHLPFNGIQPPVHIEQVTADGKVYDASRAMRLPPLVRDLSFTYTALSFVAPEKVRFRYRLEGQDPQWKEVVNDRRVQYSNLAPGRYRFRVIAANNSGVWNEAGASLDFSIAPAYYQTRWFEASIALVALAVFWAAYQFRLHQVAHEFDLRLDERVNERTRIARELHDTLLQSFHGVLFRFQAVSNLLPGRPAEAQQALERALDQAERAIVDGRDAVHDLRSSTLMPNDLAEAIGALGAGLAAQHAPVPPPAVHIAVEGPSRMLHPIVRDDVYRIGAEALRNAFRHAKAREIVVTIRYGERELEVVVRDDGKGMDPRTLDREPEGHWGLRGMRERAELVGGTLEVWSEPGSGTQVELSVPASRAYAVAPGRPRFWWVGRKTGTDA